MTPSAWKPPDADRQAAGWTPPAEDRVTRKYDAATRGGRLNDKQKELPDTFLGTLTKDTAGLPAQVATQVATAPLNTLQAIEHPIDAIGNAWHALTSIPAEAWQDLKAGKYGKVGARAFELFAPILGSEEGAALASRGARVAGDAAAAVGEKVAPVGAAVKAGVKAAAPDVAAGAAKAGVGMAASEMLPGGPVKYALGAAPAYSGARQIARGISKGATAAREAFQARLARAVDSIAAEAGSPGEALAKQQGLDWSALKPEEQAMLEHAAKAQANAAQTAPPRPFVGPQQPAAEVEATAPPATGGGTVADMIRAEMEAKRAAAAPAPEPEAPPQFVGAHEPRPATVRTAHPVRPPLRSAESPAPEIQPQPTAPPPRTEVIQQTPTAPAAEAGPVSKIDIGRKIMASMGATDVTAEDAALAYHNLEYAAGKSGKPIEVLYQKYTGEPFPGVAEAQAAAPATPKLQPYETTGESIGPIYHGGKAKLTEIDPSKLNQRDYGFYGKGFYVSKSPTYAKTYGGKITEATLSPDARVLVGSLAPNDAPAGLVDAVVNWFDSRGRQAAVTRGKEAAFEAELNSIRTDIPAWKNALDSFGEANGYDVIKHSDGEIVVKNPSAVVFPNTAKPAPKPLTNAQAEAAMVRKQPVLDPTEARYMHDAVTGERKSPQRRAGDITAHNIDQKAKRFADAFHAEGITAEDVGNMTASDHAIMTEGLVAKGVLKEGEMPPNQSIPLIRKYLRQLEKRPKAKNAAD